MRYCIDLFNPSAEVCAMGEAVAGRNGMEAADFLIEEASRRKTGAKE